MESYGSDEWLTRALAEEAAKDNIQPQGDATDVDEEVEEERPITFVEARASIGLLMKFLQQALTDVFPLLQKLKAVDYWMIIDSILKRTQSTLHCYFNLNPRFKNARND